MVNSLLQGDVIEYLDFGEKPVGHEAAKRRPAVVVSNDFYNMSTSGAIVCPVTSRNNGFPLHIALPAGLRVTGWVVTETIQMIDDLARDARVIDHLDPESNEMRAILQCVKSFF